MASPTGRVAEMNSKAVASAALRGLRSGRVRTPTDEQYPTKRGMKRILYQRSLKGILRNARQQK